MIDFPGDTMDENPPTDEGDTGLIPGLGRFHMPQNNYTPVPQLLRLCITTTEASTP